MPARMAVALGLGVCLLMGADGPQKAASIAEPANEGTWWLSAGQKDGKPLTKEEIEGGRLIIRGNHYTLTLPGGETITGIQTIDQTTVPNTIDITDTSGSRQGQTCLGIVSSSKNEFRVAFAPPGGARPESFETVPDTGQWMHVWKRVQP